MSEYGVQPARDLVNRHALSRRAIAWLLGVEPWDLYAVLRGKVAPPTTMPERLSIVLDVAPERLFTAEALAAATKDRRVSA